jgi:O-antigen/teichoic acid export membrane protein
MARERSGGSSFTCEAVTSDHEDRGRSLVAARSDDEAETAPAARTSMVRDVLLHSIQYGAAAILSRAASILLVPVYTRILVPADYGRLDLLIAFASLVNVTVALEISQGVARHYVDAPTDADRRAYASTSLWFSVSAYSLFVVIAFALADSLSQLVLGGSHPELIQVGGLWIWATGMFYLIQNQLRWKLDPRGYAAVSVLATVASIGFSIILVAILRWGVVGVLVGQTIGMLLGLALGLRLLAGVYEPTFEKGRLIEMLRFSAPLVPSGIAVFVTLYVDRIAVAHFMTLGDVGIFGIGYRIASITSLTMIAFQAALTPLVYQHYRERETPEELAGLFRLFVAFALFLCLGLAMYADELVSIFTTPPFYGGATVVPLLAPAVLIAGMYVFAPGLAIQKRTGSIALLNVGQAVLNLGLNIVLIPILGIEGAALATLVGASATFVGYMALSQRSYYVPHRWIPIGLGITATIGLFLVTRPFAGTGLAEILAEAGAVTAALVLFFQLGLIEPAILRAAIRRRDAGGDRPASA